MLRPPERRRSWNSSQGHPASVVSFFQRSRKSSTGLPSGRVKTKSSGPLPHTHLQQGIDILRQSYESPVAASGFAGIQADRAVQQVHLLDAKAKQFALAESEGVGRRQQCPQPQFPRILRQLGIVLFLESRPWGRFLEMWKAGNLLQLPCPMRQLERPAQRLMVAFDRPWSRHHATYLFNMSVVTARARIPEKSCFRRPGGGACSPSLAVLCPRGPAPSKDASSLFR